MYTGEQEPNFHVIIWWDIAVNHKVVYQTQEGQYVLYIIISLMTWLVFFNIFKYPDNKVYLMTGEEDKKLGCIRWWGPQLTVIMRFIEPPFKMYIYVW